ncbi:MULTISPECIES: TadE/TadG family type IV pilus assembly protein [unclassified Micromonospora]|uniref:TadE/TadG family type IV pilus assembly protein n=1 Tax=unclassified Micromonospora TaxID=2617518 RepID=UPI0020B372D2|nr:MULTISPECIES: TadE/TadG family type IV pilus assembly protein [unclassified Micromonospora]MDM4783404.1 TadE/TadG family type IV pilus assembly protein [Micromonospora sp. b486]
MQHPPTSRTRARRRAGPAADRGSVSVELALGYVPLMVLAVLAIVACLRLASAAIDVHSAAAAASRRASLADTPAEARRSGADAASAALTARGTTCQPSTVTIDPGTFTPGGQVSATVTCRVRLEDLSGLGLPGTVSISATSHQPLDPFGARP